jgi:hypothetical protein
MDENIHTLFNFPDLYTHLRCFLFCLYEFSLRTGGSAQYYVGGAGTPGSQSIFGFPLFTNAGILIPGPSFPGVTQFNSGSSAVDLSALTSATALLTSRVQLLEAFNISTGTAVTSLSSRMSSAESSYNFLTASMGAQSTTITLLQAANISVQGAVSSLSFRMRAAEDSSGSFSSTLSLHSNQIASMNSSLLSNSIILLQLRSANSSMQSAIGSLTNRVSGVESSASQLTGRVLNQTLQISALIASNSSLSARLDSSLGQLNAQLATQTQQISSLVSSNASLSFRLSAVETLSGTSAIVSTIGVAQTSSNNLQLRLLNVETLTGTSTLVSQFLGLRDLSTISTNLAATVVGMRDLSAATTNIASTLIAIRDLTGTSNIVNTVGASQTSASNHQTRLLNLETVGGTSTLVSQFKSIRDYSVSTFSLYTTIAGMSPAAVSALESRVLRTSQPFIMLVMTASQTIQTTTDTFLTWGLVQQQTLGYSYAAGQTSVQLTSMWSATNPTRITLPIDGLYSLTASIVWATNPNGCRDGMFVINGDFNGNSHPRISINVATAAVTQSGWPMSSTIAASARFIAGDYVEVYVQHTAGSAIQVVAGLSMSNVQAVFLGP